MPDQTYYFHKQQTAFLDIINPVLWVMLEKKFNFKKLTPQEVIASGCLDHLFFYHSSELEATENRDAVKISKMIRRYIAPDRPPNSSDPIVKYINFYKLYLDKYVTVEELDNYVKSNGEQSTITDLLILSKYVYAKDNHERGKALAKRVLKQVAKYDLQLTCTYVYLYKAIQKTNPNSALEEYRAFFNRTPKSDNSRNIYLRFLLSTYDDSEYQEIKQTILSTRHIYHPNLIQFFTLYLRHLKIDPILLKKDIEQIAEHLSSAQFLQRDSVFTHIKATMCTIAKKIEKSEKRIMHEVKYASLDDLPMYRHNDYLSKDTLHLIEIATGYESFKDPIDEIGQATNISEALATCLVLCYLEGDKKDPSVEMHILKSLLSKISIEYFRDIIEIKIASKSTDHTVLMTVFLKRQDYQAMLDAIHAHYIDVSRLNTQLLVTLANRCGIADKKLEFIYEFVKDKNRVLAITSGLGLNKHVVANNFDKVLNSINELNWNSIRAIYTAISAKNTAKLQLFTSEIIRIKQKDVYSKLADCIIELSCSLDKAIVVNEYIEKNTSDYKQLYSYYACIGNKLDMSIIMSKKHGREFLFFDKLLIKWIYFTYQTCYLDSFDERIIDYTWHLSQKYSGNSLLQRDKEYFELLACIGILACGYARSYGKNDIFLRYFNQFYHILVEAIDTIVERIKKNYKLTLLKYFDGSVLRPLEYSLNQSDFYKLATALSSYFLFVELLTKKNQGSVSDSTRQELEQNLELILTIKNFHQAIEEYEKCSIINIFFCNLDRFLISVIEGKEPQDALDVEIAKNLFNVLLFLDTSFAVLSHPRTNSVFRCKTQAFIMLTLFTDDVSKFRQNVQLLDAMCSLPVKDDTMMVNLWISIYYISHVVDNRLNDITDDDAALIKEIILKNHKFLTTITDKDGRCDNKLYRIFSNLLDQNKFKCAQDERAIIVSAMNMHLIRRGAFQDVISLVLPVCTVDNQGASTSQTSTRHSARKGKSVTKSSRSNR